MAKSSRSSPTTCKPLVALFNNPFSKPSARIEYWLLELQQVSLCSRVSNPANYTSKHPVEDSKSHNYEFESEEHFSFVVRNAVSFLWRMLYLLLNKRLKVSTGFSLTRKCASETHCLAEKRKKGRKITRGTGPLGRTWFTIDLKCL